MPPSEPSPKEPVFSAYDPYSPTSGNLTELDLPYRVTSEGRLIFDAHVLLELLGKAGLNHARVVVCPPNIMKDEPNQNNLLGGRLVIDRDIPEVKIEDHPVKIARKEFQVLEYLTNNIGKYGTSSQILDVCWPGSSNLKLVALSIKRLRDIDPLLQNAIETKRGWGYRFNNEYKPDTENT